MFKIVAAALVLLLCACTAGSSIYSGANGKTPVVSKADWEGFQSYLANVGSTNSGAFVLAVYGGKSDGYGYSSCKSSDCIAGTSYITRAMDECRQGGGTECVLFARSSSIVVNYRVEN